MRKLLIILVVFMFCNNFLLSEDNSGHNIKTGSPWMASCVQGVVSADTKTSVKDDFYLYVNKDALLEETILPGYSSAGVISNRGIQNNKDILSLFTENTKVESEDSQLALELYKMFINWDKRNKQGMKPLERLVGKIESISSIKELSDYYKNSDYDDITVNLFPFDYMADFEDSSKNIIVLSTSSLSLDNSDEYSNLTDYGKLKKETTKDLVVYILKRLGYSTEESENKFDNCIKLESELAKSIMTLSERKSPDFVAKINNHYSLEELKEAQGCIPVTDLMYNYGFNNIESILVTEPKWLDKLRNLYNDDNLTLLKDYLIVYTARSLAAFLDKDCFIHMLDYSNMLGGVSGYLSDEQYAAEMTQTYLAWPVARLYCEKFVTEKDKENVKEIMRDVIKCYSEMLSENTFLSQETKKKAQEKLGAMTIRSLYPDDWTLYSYSGLILKRDDDDTLYDYLERIGEFERKRKIERFSKPIDKTYWDSWYPTNVNAFHNPMDNSINILAAFCRGEIYQSNMSIEEMYSKIGTVIGHEISHAFDGSGGYFDKDGNINNWWTDEDRSNFYKRIQNIADFASKVTYWDNVNLNGAIMTGEICADMGGVSVMLRMAREIKDFDYDKFFRGYAQLWRSISTYNSTVAAMDDEHPPMFFRVNGTLQQFDEFLNCYGIKEGDGMYLAPENRVAIW